MPKKNAQKCPKGNTELLGTPLRVRFFPSFTAFTEQPPKWEDDDMKYLCYGEEYCPTSGRRHYQGCVYFYDKQSIKNAQKLLGIENSHMENIMLTDPKTCIEYCKKDGSFVEYGIKPKQGKRNDLEAVAEMITTHKISVDELAVENPMLYHQYGRTLHKLEDIALRKKWRTEMTLGVWYWGNTGVGKSHKAFENYNPETHYVYPYDNGWWDGYTGQENVVINDFRGCIPYNEMLQMVDKWVYCVKRRGREPAPFISKTVIITSSLPPHMVYKNRETEDKLDQLLRRFTVIELK